MLIVIPAHSAFCRLRERSQRKLSASVVRWTSHTTMGGFKSSSTWCIHASGKLHKDYTVYEDVKSILPIYIHVYPVRPCRDDLCEIIPSLWGAVARHDRSDLFIIACGQSHLFMNMLWSAMISCELSYHVAAVLPVSCGSNFPHKSLVLNLSSKGHRYHTCIWDKVILGRRLKGYTSNWRFGWY